MSGLRITVDELRNLTPEGEARLREQIRQCFTWSQIAVAVNMAYDMSQQAQPITESEAQNNAAQVGETRHEVPAT